MPSSMIFVGLVVMWLLILVPAVARRRQEVARPSVSALSGRVLERPPRRDLAPAREPAGGSRPGGGREAGAGAGARRRDAGRNRGRSAPAPRGEPRGQPRPRGSTTATPTGRDVDGDRRPPSRRARTEHRPLPAGRGGYDPQAAALAARARYAFRQRVVLILLILAVGTAVAAGLTLPQLWWAHGASISAWSATSAYLRRQVQGGGGDPSAPVGPRRCARRRRPRGPDAAPIRATRRRQRSADLARPAIPTDRLDVTDEPDAATTERRRHAGPRTRRSTRWRSRADRGGPGVGAAGPQRRSRADDPSRRAVRPCPASSPRRHPPVPIGTTLVEGEEDDPALHELESVTRPDYRRASGQ